MKIENKYIKIKIGSKIYTFKNLILDTYINKMVENQYIRNYGMLSSHCPPFLNECYIKFGRKLVFDETSEFTRDDFDVELPANDYNIEVSKSKSNIESKYTYNSFSDEKIDATGKKITTMAFFSTNSEYAYACVDLAEYSLTIQANEELNIVRCDNLSTEGIFYSKFGQIKYPVHLSSIGIKNIPSKTKDKELDPETGLILHVDETANAILESIGFGTNETNIRKEVVLTEENEINTDNQLIFKNIFECKNKLNILEPNFRYPTSKLYPTDTNNYFTYAIFKFRIIHKIYRGVIGSSNFFWEKSDYWYTLSTPINGKEKFDYAITYERE